MPLRGSNRYLVGSLCVAISPTLADRGRRVSLRIPNAPPMLGVLVGAEWGESSGMIHYDGDRFPVATYLDKLEWADEQLL